MPPVKREPDTAPVVEDDLTPAPDITPAELADMRAKIEAYEAAELQRETGAFTGTARCVNRACTAFDASLPVALKVEVKEMRAEDTPALVLSTSEYLRPVDEADLACPKCGVSRAIMREEPREYAAMAPR